MDGSSSVAAPRSNPGSESPTDPELATALAAFRNLDYRDRFWPGRRYEDQADRIALRAMLPATGGRLMDVGAGFGRLADEYDGYREVLLVDPSETMLASARERLGADPRFDFLFGSVQRLPATDASLDALVCVRTLHHVGDLRPVITEFARVLRPGGVLVIEIANKRHLKAILAWLMRRRRSSPLRRGSEPYADISLLPQRRRPAPSGGRGAAPRWLSSTSYLHAPDDVRAGLARAGFSVHGIRSVGLLRPTSVTHHVPARLLAGLERVLQPALGLLAPGPSMFIAATRAGDPGRAPARRRIKRG